MRKKFPEGFKKCPEYLRHKTTLAHPAMLQEHGITLTKYDPRPSSFQTAHRLCFVLSCTGHYTGPTSSW